ncbi:MAG: single-stranded DNA-binding protein [Spirochaetaceae bacterium]|nr:single-stranded DNA-binding protein [Spirochaetaceae bacterium]RKX71999.1 MAG: single-stranded DNA-binding protein [Spirochaetota bacterium]RKX87071.1 MAG: single-stranded DNA-binding protein [Spirochaetota bacterium]RKX96789.1 MAG: single-stranded DNA-binding protein [Spirochaetota bacterium]
MATDINKVVLVGRLTRDAEQSYTQSGFALLKFSIAVNRNRKQGDQWIEEASFFDVTVWGRQGEAIVNYMTKGKQVAVEGQLRQDRWEDKNDGSKRSKVVIDASNIQLLGSRDGGSQGGGSSSSNWNNSASSAPQSAPRPQQGPPPTTNFEDDIPF